MLKKIWEKILEYDVIVISRHIRPDGDASGSQLGLKYLIQANTKGKKIYCEGEANTYAGKLVGNVDTDIKIDPDTKYLNVILPLGISFFTFQNISYLVDVYKGDVAAQKNVFQYATYITLFPQLIAGPIVRYDDVAAELDNRVINLERTNFRYVTQEQIPEELDFASVDVSFISLSLILPVLYTFLKQNGQAVCLIKPQFEAGKENVGKKGVVRDKNVHIAVIEKIIDVIISNNFKLLGLDFSPVKGPEGNIEYLCHIQKSDKGEILCKTSPLDVVENSYKTLKEANNGSCGFTQS